MPSRRGRGGNPNQLTRVATTSRQKQQAAVLKELKKAKPPPIFTLEGQRARDIDAAKRAQFAIESTGGGRQIPILGGSGPGGGIISSLLTGAARFALRAPGTRQLITTGAGRASTLQPFKILPPLGGIAAATGLAITADTILDVAGKGLDKIQDRGKGAVMPQPGTGQSLVPRGGSLPAVGGQLPPGTTVVKVWNTGTAQFARLLDGRIAVQRKDGTIKVYRPQKHIVIPRNPRVGTLIRADKRLERLTKGLRKVVRSGKR